MPDLALDVLAPTATPASVRLHRAALRMADRLAALCELLDPTTAPGLRSVAAGADGDAGAYDDGTCLGLPALPPQPVDRLAMAAVMTPVELDLLVLAGAAHEHEVLAAALRRLHPAGHAAPTPGLAAQLAEHGLLPGLRDGVDGLRPALRRALTDSVVLEFQPGGPFWDRSFAVDPALWDALHEGRAWPAGAVAVELAPVMAGLEAWLAGADAQAAGTAVARWAPVTIEARAERPLAAAARVVGLAAALGHAAAVLHVADPTRVVPAALAAVARGAVPVLVAEGPLDLGRVPAPVFVCLPEGTPNLPAARPSVDLAMPALDRRARRRLWDTVAPATACPSGLEPLDVAVLARQVEIRRGLDAPPPAPSAERTTSPCPGAVLIHPRAGWDDLVLVDDTLAQLREAAARGHHEGIVLERWRFLEGRPGASGLRLLFCGPPGTGKTLAAEVLASELERDLLVTNLAQMVSKWIGETEKNLAAAFDAAERGDCVLLFDEADALFGRRTEVGDSRDRYANLETAYLLGRLEQFDGVAILATNLRQNIDPAFGRRLEFLVPFDPPGPAERLALWRRHLPAAAPLADDVDLDVLANVYEVVGAHIRNAAVAAAYLAASAPGGPEPIGWAHLLHTLGREYDKSGLAFPGQAPDRFERKDPGWRR